jgi:hypothetical protein
MYKMIHVGYDVMIFGLSHLPKVLSSPSTSYYVIRCDICGWHYCTYSEIYFDDTVYVVWEREL